MSFSFSCSSSLGKWTLERPTRRLPWPSGDLWLAEGTESVQRGKGLKSQPSCFSIGNPFVFKHQIERITTTLTADLAIASTELSLFEINFPNWLHFSRGENWICLFYKVTSPRGVEFMNFGALMAFLIAGLFLQYHISPALICSVDLIVSSARKKVHDFPLAFAEIESL